MPEDQPWLQNPRWEHNSIASDTRHTLWVLWLFAICWNALTLPLLIQFEGILDQIERQPLSALVLLFPVAGIGLLATAIQATRRQRRFGATPLRMDPFPGALGGHVGGTIDTNIPFDHHNQVSVQLSCIHSYVTQKSSKKLMDRRSSAATGKFSAFTGKSDGRREPPKR